MKGSFLFIVGLLLIVLAVLPFTRSRPGALEWHTDDTSAYAEARGSQKAILTFLFTDWCSFCKQMDSITFADPRIIEEMGDSYVWLRLNAEKDRAGIEMQRRFVVSGYPTILILDSDGRELDRISGFVPPDQFPDRVRLAVEGPESLGSARKLADREPESPEAQYALAGKLMERNQFEEAAGVFAKVIELDPRNSKGKTDASLYYYAETQASMGQYPPALATLERLEVSFPDSGFSVEASLMRAEILFRTGEQDKARVLLAGFLEDNPDHRAADRIRQVLETESF